MKKFIPSQFEAKWQKKWEEDGLYSSDLTKPNKFYVLAEFAYPSGDLHMGHWFTFSGADIFARFKRMQGYQVFFPNGFDAFGLPAENAAIKNNIHPQEWTMGNITRMKEQFATMGASFNFDHEVITCLPEYYRWNQWIFLKMLEKGLAYRGSFLANWCPSCQTVLANEGVEAGLCWRCSTEVIQKEVEQWFLKITGYAQELIWPENPSVDWPLSLREAQNNWIGRSEGTKITFSTENSDKKIIVLTTRPDTIFGATFVVVSPEHPLLNKFIEAKYRNEVEKYIKKTKSKSELERKENKEKTGVFTGTYVKNPLTGKNVPVWVADYVLPGYGTGAVMGVPAHDQRDYEFARKFDLPIISVVEKAADQNSTITTEIDDLDVSEVAIALKKMSAPQECYTPTSRIYRIPFEDRNKVIGILKQAGLGTNKDYERVENGEGFVLNTKPASLTFIEVYEGDGVHINSGFLNGLDQKQSIKTMNEWLIKKGLGEKSIDYHFHDWSISRQRYWGTPIPVIHCPKCGIVPVPEKDLPIELPLDVDYTPKGKSPLASNESWLKVKCPKCGRDGTRDPDTMDTFIDSSWYFFRFISPKYNEGPFDTKLAQKIMPVDIYFGGAEHNLGHTLYSRFFTKFFHNLGLTELKEYALRRVNHGIVLGPDGNKMSKSKGNVINPDEEVKKYGTDAVRVHMAFFMPYEGSAGPWISQRVWGPYRFLDRVWQLFDKVTIGHPALDAGSTTIDSGSGSGMTINDLIIMHKTIKKVNDDVEAIRFNTAVAALMEWLNYLSRKEKVSKEEYKTFLLLLVPFAPHITEELWEMIGEKYSIHQQNWPKFDEKYLEEEEINITVQVNGKVRDQILMQKDIASNKEVVEKQALESSKVQKFINGKKIAKTIFVPGKIINFVLIEK